MQAIILAESLLNEMCKQAINHSYAQNAAMTYQMERAERIAEDRIRFLQKV